jgi:hypothetical protein
MHSPCGPWPLFQFLNLYTVDRTPWTGDQPVARPLLTYKTTQTEETHRYPCLEWDSNPRYQYSNGWRRFMPLTARPLWSVKKMHTIQKFLWENIKRPFGKSRREDNFKMGSHHSSTTNTASNKHEASSIATTPVTCVSARCSDFIALQTTKPWTLITLIFN